MSFGTFLSPLDRAASGPRLLTLTQPRGSALICSRPSANIARRPQISSSPAVDRRREVWITAQLVGALLAQAEDLGDLNDSKELPPRHSQQYP